MEIFLLIFFSPMIILVSVGILWMASVAIPVIFLLPLAILAKMFIPDTKLGKFLILNFELY